VLSLFNVGKTDVHNEELSERTSVITEDLKGRRDDYVRGNRRFAIDELHELFPCFAACPLRQCISNFFLSCTP
jgi:hypothetical protein